jgi:hypothetical protein
MIRSALAVLIWAPVQAGAFSLEWPLDCTLGQSCFVQQYPDRDPGPGHTDYTCGPLSYDGHSGTDIALPTLDAMTKGVTVRAAAPGRVRAIRDGMADISVDAPNAPDITNRDCGNAVVIDHADGWQTTYCHMARGSVLVRSGDMIEVGQALGKVGLSGQTSFPHLHLDLRHKGRIIDPADPDELLTCDAPPAPALWAMPVPYVPGGIIAIGFSDSLPEFDAVKAGQLSPATLPPDSAGLVLWAHLFGVRHGDRLEVAITGPEGVVLSEIVDLTRTQARVLRSVGKRLGAARWPEGEYRGEVRHLRGGDLIGEQSVMVRIGP